MPETSDKKRTAHPVGMIGLPVGESIKRCTVPKLSGFFPLATTDDAIVSMAIYKDRLFVATTKGVFVKGEDDVFRPLKFEVEP